ncbi:MAG: ubiquitin-activating enzyme [Actinobacteria bacterium]|nr:ubiquitin-activating enzyme [Actinomycetota bacterium]
MRAAVMRDRLVAGRMPFAQAVGLVDDRLDAIAPGMVERLSAGLIAAAYPTRRFAAGWRVRLDCPDGETRRIDLLVTSRFPAGYPRTALVDRPAHLEWPHVERDGVLCLLPIGAEVDPDDPAEVAMNLFGRSARLLAELLEGGIVDRDFREEFLTYWFYASDGDAPVVRSLIRPGGPSRTVRIHRDDRGDVTVAENDQQLTNWYHNISGGIGAPRTRRGEPAAMIWLPEPLLPSSYPTTGADVRSIAEMVGGGALEVLTEVATGTKDEAIVLFGALGRGGPGLIAVTTRVANRPRGVRGGVEHPLTKGFRHRPLPSAVATERMFSVAPLVRATVQRADASWIHGRGADARTVELLRRRVVVVGCGSLGSSVAVRLAKAGIGRLDLVDHERLSWSNVGRHELGAEDVGRYKVEALAERIRRQLPHLEIHAHALDIHGFMLSREDVLDEADLIVCATGSWGAEAAVDAWRSSRAGIVPLVYGWLEDRALAAHAVTIADGACLRCGFDRTGTPAFSAIRWPRGRPVDEEPACGNHYQPYGAVELGHAVDLTSRAALDALLERPTAASHRAWLAPIRDVVGAGAEWSGQLRERAPASLSGATTIDLDWPVGCAACATTSRHAA